MSLPQATLALTQRAIRCSNPECLFHIKSNGPALFFSKTMVNLVVDVLRPGSFAPVLAGAKYFCEGCGWVFTMDETDQPITVSPELDTNKMGSMKK